jgi:hypothetical protein
MRALSYCVNTVQSVKIDGFIFVHTIYRRKIVFIKVQSRKCQKTLKNKGKIP